MYSEYDFLLVTVDFMQIKFCSVGFLNIEAQDMVIFLVLITSEIMYLGIDETTGQDHLIIATNMMFLVLKSTYDNN